MIISHSVSPIRRESFLRSRSYEKTGGEEERGSASDFSLLRHPYPSPLHSFFPAHDTFPPPTRLKLKASPYTHLIESYVDRIPWWERMNGREGGNLSNGVHGARGMSNGTWTSRGRRSARGRSRGRTSDGRGVERRVHPGAWERGRMTVGRGRTEGSEIV